MLPRSSPSLLLIILVRSSPYPSLINRQYLITILIYFRKPLASFPILRLDVPLGTHSSPHPLLLKSRFHLYLIWSFLVPHRNVSIHQIQPAFTVLAVGSFRPSPILPAPHPTVYWLLRRLKLSSVSYFIWFTASQYVSCFTASLACCCLVLLTFSSPISFLFLCLSYPFTKDYILLPFLVHLHFSRFLFADISRNLCSSYLYIFFIIYSVE